MSGMVEREASVIKAQIWPFDNRLPALSAQARRVAQYLLTTHEFFDINDRLVTTGRVVEGIGRRRNKAGYASVSRTLRRMGNLHLVQYFIPGCRQWGNGLGYDLTEAARALDWSDGGDAAEAREEVSR